MRSTALDALRRYRDGGELPPPPDEATLSEMMGFVVGRELPDQYREFLTAELSMRWPALTVFLISFVAALAGPAAMAQSAVPESRAEIALSFGREIAPAYGREIARPSDGKSPVKLGKTAAQAR